jgi:hypothetical protein
MGTFEDQGLAYMQRFSFHLKYFLPVFVSDPEIFANGHHLLAHLVAVASATLPPRLAIIPGASCTVLHVFLAKVIL